MSTELEILVTGELREIKAALTGLRQDIAKVGQVANTGASGGRALGASLGVAATKARAASDATTGLRTAIAGAVAQAKLLVLSIGVAGAVTGLIRMADTATRLRGQLGLVTKGQGELTLAMAETFAIAQRTRQGLEATVNLYARVARAGKTSQAQTLALTETINQAVTLSFSNAQAAEAALFQLGQGLGSGTLRGQELNSVLEQTPRLAQAIAEGLVKLGKIKDPGGLRKFANEQGIDAGLVVQALATQQEKLRAEFAKLPPTIADSFTTLHNAMIKFVGDTDKANGASQDLAKSIRFLASNFDHLAGFLVTGVKLYAAWFLAFRTVPFLVNTITAAFVGLTAAAAASTVPVTASGAAMAATGAEAAEAAVGVEAFAAAEVSVGGASAVAAGASAGGIFTRLAAKVAAAGGAVRLLGLAFTTAAGLAFAAFAGWEIGTELEAQFLKVQLFGIALAQGLHKIAFQIGQSFKLNAELVKTVFAEAFNFAKGKAADFLANLGTVLSAVPGATANAAAQVASVAEQKIRKSITATESFSATIARFRDETKKGLDEIDQGYSDLADAAIDAHTKVAAVTKGTKQPDPDTGTAIKGVVDQLALAKDAAERALAALEQLYTDGRISVRAYYAEKVRLQQASVDADIATAQRDAKLATTDAERGAALTKVIILERQRRDVAIQAAHDQGKAEEDLVDQLAQVEAKLLGLQGQGAKARTIELEAEYRDLLRRLGVEANTAGIDLVHKLINVEAAKAGLDQLSGEFSKTTGALGQLEATTAAQVSAGLLSNATAEDRLARARATAIEQLTTQRAAVSALYEQYQQPEALLALQAIDEKIAQLSISTDDWRGKLQDAGTEALTTFFKELADGAHSAGDAVRDLAINFTQSLAAMAAQALAKKAIGAIFDLFGAGDKTDGGAAQIATAAAAGAAQAVPLTVAATALGSAGAVVLSGAAALGISAAALASAAAALTVANSIGVASVAHTGGIAGEIAGSLRSMSPYAFVGAPRYHSGGVAGVSPGEVAAVLQRGEEIITRTDPRHRFNGGRGGDAGGGRQPGLVTTPIVAIGEAAIADALAGVHGERVVLTHVRNNWGGLTQGSKV